MKSPYRARGGQREETERVKFLKCGGDALPCQLAGTQVPGGQVLLVTLPGGRSGAAGTSPWRDPAAWGAAGMQKPVGNMANCHQLLLAKRHFPRGKTSQWRNAARKRSGVGTESREDRARPVWPQPSGTPAPTPTLGEPRQVAEQRRGWPSPRLGAQSGADRSGPFTDPPSRTPTRSMRAAPLCGRVKDRAAMQSANAVFT